jgi:hypothetical protein
VTGMARTVIANLEQGGLQSSLERRAQPVDSRAHADSLP